MADAGDLKGERAQVLPLSYENRDRESSTGVLESPSNGQSVGNESEDAAIIRSIEQASEARAWDAVLALTTELRERRLSREGVVTLEAERKKRQG